VGIGRGGGDEEGSGGWREPGEREAGRGGGNWKKGGGDWGGGVNCPALAAMFCFIFQPYHH
jgi:hypothetical protein